MKSDALKLELIEWLTKLDDIETIKYLKIVKDSNLNSQDWWNDLSDLQKAGIKRGLKDVDEGRTLSHEDVKNKYGL